VFAYEAIFRNYKFNDTMSIKKLEINQKYQHIGGALGGILNWRELSMV